MAEKYSDAFKKYLLAIDRMDQFQSFKQAWVDQEISTDEYLILYRLQGNLQRQESLAHICTVLMRINESQEKQNG